MTTPGAQRDEHETDPDEPTGGRAGLWVALAAGILILLAGGVYVAHVVQEARRTRQRVRAADTRPAAERHAPPETSPPRPTQSALMEVRLELRQLGAALQIYAIRHDGAYPRSLDALAEEGHVADGDLFTDPAGERYAYVPGLTGDSPPTTVLAYGRRAYEGGRTVALRVDGTVRTYDSVKALNAAIAGAGDTRPAGTRPDP